MTRRSPDPQRPRPGFWSHLDRRGEAVALVLGQRRRSLSYVDLDAAVSAAADALGVGRKLLVLEMAPRVEPIVIYLAALRAGHPVALVAPGSAQDWAARFPGATAITQDSAWTVPRDTVPYPHELHSDLAVLLPTSGSSGSPRLVRLSHENLAANADGIAECLHISEDDRSIVVLPLHYSYGLSVLNSHLAAGASIALYEGSVIDEGFVDDFHEAGATNFAGVPHTFHLLHRSDFDYSRLKGLRFVTQAGGRLEPERVAELASNARSQGWRFFVMYGQTEATARISVLDPELALDHPGSVGRVLPGGSVRLVRPDDGSDEPRGELVYRGPNVMLGYAEGPDDLARGREVEELETGDLAEISSDGLITLFGRTTRRIKPFGVRIELDALERDLALRGIQAVCAGDDSVLVVAVAGGGSAGLDDDIATRLGLPVSTVKVIDDATVPRLDSGKVDQVGLLTAARSQDETGAFSSVLALFRSRFGPEVGPGDSFLSCGGDSLSYIEISVALEDLLSNLPREWHRTSIAELERLRGHGSGRRVETSVVLRGVAIALIVGTHCGLWSLPGGAHVLLAVAGFNFARFQRAARAKEKLRSLARVAVPSFLWIGGAALLSARVAWPQALAVNSFAVQRGQPWQYWFIEALLWLLGTSMLLLSIPLVRRTDRIRPLAVALIALLVGLVVRFELLFPAADHHRLGRPVEVAWLFAFGWAAAVAPTWGARLLVGALGLSAVPGFFGSISREVVVAGGLLLLLIVPNLPVPRLLIRPLSLVASASLYIYLVHWQVFPVVVRNLGSVVGFIASLAAGLLAWRTAEALIMIRRSRAPG